MGIVIGQNQSLAEHWDRGRVERGNWLNPESIPKRKGAVFPEGAAGRAVPRPCSRGQGAWGGGGGPS